MNLLIVDDEIGVREGLAGMIEWKKHGITRVDLAKSGQEALEMFRSCLYDLVMTDIKMPKTSGLELSEQLRILYPQTRVILLSGHAEFEYARKAIELNIEAYLLKPVDIDELLQLIDRLVHQLAGHSDNAVVNKAKEFARNNYMRHLPATEVAAYVGRESNYFSHIFKKYEGISFRDYLYDIRIERAKFLLCTTDALTYVIAKAVGFPNSRHFAHVFKKSTGLTPSEYRKKHGGM